MPTALTSGLLKRLTAFPTVLPDAAGPITLAQNSAALNVFSYSKIGSTGLVLRARQLQFAAPSQGGVNLLVSADSVLTSKPIDAYAASQMDPHRSSWGDPEKLQATDSLALQAQDTQNGPASFDLWATWSVEVAKPTLADRLRWPTQFRPLDAQEQALWNKLGKNANGTGRLLLPRTLSWILENEIRNNITEAYPAAASGDVTSASPLVFMQENVGPGEILCIAGLWGTPGSGSDGLTLEIGIGDDDEFYTVQTYGLFSGTPPFSLIWGRKVTGQLTTTNTVSGARAGATIWKMPLTEELAVRNGEVDSGDVFDRITAGVV